MSEPSPRVVVITGAASGIGYATAELFRDLGDTVYGLDISPTVPAGVTYVECNVGDRACVDAAVETCARDGRIDVLANVAGVVQFGRIETVTDEEWDRVHAVDLKGPFMLIRAALPHIRAAKGNIVNVSSVAGNVAQPYATAYAAAKGGLTQLTRALALELSPEGIRVNAVCPGVVRTDMVINESTFGLFRPDLENPGLEDAKEIFLALHMLPVEWLEARDISNAVLWLASDEARYVTGVALPVDAGALQK
jgi:NAD(P)-dependent dehydrogenase (short-subunit alcohol dehydrogenase family)